MLGIEAEFKQHVQWFSTVPSAISKGKSFIDAKLRTENTRLRRAEAAAERRAGEAERELQRLRALLSQSEVGAAAVEVAKACKKKHATERARLACDTCSLGNKRGRQGMKAR